MVLQELRLAASTESKSTLGVRQQAIPLKEHHQFLVDYSFHDLIGVSG